MKIDNKKVGIFISELRKSKKMTQEELGQKLCVDRGTVSKWERGVYIPNPDDLLLLSKTLDVSVNEILIGERETKGNKDQLDNVTIEILKKNRKIKRFLVFGSGLIIFIIVLFLIYYFINNYNSITVYSINGESENFIVSNGILIVSPEKGYLDIGYIENLHNLDIKNITLYYESNGKKHLICEDDEKIGLLENEFNYNEYFSYEDLKYMKSNLFIEIIFGEEREKEIIKLTLKKDFSNNHLFHRKSDSISNSPTKRKIEITIPEYIKKNFKLDEQNKIYYLDSFKEDVEIKQSYFYDVDIYIVDILYDDYFEQYTYYHESKDFSYVKFKDNEEIDNFNYNISRKTCINGKCDLELINYFNNEYLEKIKFE